MISEYSHEEIHSLVHHQLLSFWPQSCETIDLKAIEIAVCRAKECFSTSKNKYYKKVNGKPIFNVFHSGQYSIFLYYLANTVFKAGKGEYGATLLYYLNKIMHSVDWYYEIDLPEHWAVDHPVGSVLGRAIYGDGFSISQGCTVGNSRGIYPVIGQNVHMYANSAIIGNSHIGDNVIIGAGCIVKNQDVPDKVMVFGQSPNLIMKNRKDIEGSRFY